jgi:hypothetical protein
MLTAVEYRCMSLHSACLGPGYGTLVANCKIHGTTGEVPFERLAEEQQYLQPLTITEPLFIVESRKATKTQLISLDGNKYSVLVQFARKRVKFRRFEDRIELLDGGKVIDTIELVGNLDFQDWGRLFD